MRILLLALVATIVPASLTADEIAEKAKKRTAAEAAKREVERSARHYRIRVYEQFRTNRAVYNRFRQRGDDFLTAWEVAGDAIPSEDAVRWFENARQSVAQGATFPPQIPSRLEQEWVRLRAVEEQKAKQEMADLLRRKAVKETPVKREIKQPTAPRIMTPTIADLPQEATDDAVSPTQDDFNFEGSSNDSFFPPAPPATAPATQQLESNEQPKSNEQPTSNTQDDANKTESSVFKSFGRALLKSVK